MHSEFSFHNAQWLLEIYRKHAPEPDNVIVVGIKDPSQKTTKRIDNRIFEIEKSDLEGFLTLLEGVVSKTISVPVIESLFTSPERI